MSKSVYSFINNYNGAIDHNPYGDYEDWMANAIPRSILERKVFVAMNLILKPDDGFERYVEGISYHCSDEQWVIVCNMLAIARHPDSFEDYLE